MCCCVFCFKQKTAYEMRISDGSSDVCASDRRSPEEYRGELLSPPGSPNHGAERLGRIPGARHLHFEDLIGEDMSFRSPDEIRALLEARGATPDRKIISYCRFSHRTTIAYFALTQLLGYAALWLNARPDRKRTRLN